MATKLLEDITLADIYEYVNTGTVQKADENIVRYLELLDKTRAMHNRIDEFGHKEAIVAHLMKVENLSRYVANNIYNDAMEYFYSDRQISKDAWRNIIAEKIYQNYLFAIQLAATPQEVKQANDVLKEIVKVKRLDQEDPVEVDEALFIKPFKMYTSDAEYLGLPKIDRRELAKIINDKFPELSEKERIMIKREAEILPVKLFLNEHEDARKS